MRCWRLFAYLGTAYLGTVLLMSPSAANAASLEDLLAQRGVITKSEAAGVTATSGAKVFYDKGTRFEFPDSGFSAQFNTQVQVRYTYTDHDEGDDTSSFEVRRARLILSGSALHNQFSYILQADFVGTKSEEGTRAPDVRDAYIQWNAPSDLGLRMGQFKTFISRQESNSASKLQFADRSIASTLFDLGRQGGVAARYTGMSGNFFAAAGLFNGESDGEGRNRPGLDNHHTAAITVRYTALGAMDALEEGDVNYTENFALNFGAAYAYGQGTDDGGDFDKHSVSVDSNIKFHGLSVHGEFFWRSVEPDAPGSDDVQPLGFYVQSGYFLEPQKWELAARYAFTDCDNGSYAEGTCNGNDTVQQATVGLNYFFWKHSLKAQLNYDWISEEAVGENSEDIETNRIIFQMNSYF